MTKSTTAAAILPRILIANDDHAVAFLLQKTLSDISELLFIKSGDDALATVSRFNPDLILLDAEMAGARCFEICAVISRDTDHAGPPVIFITTAGDTASEARALATGAVDVISRPLNSTIVRTRIHAHLALKQRNDELLQQFREGESFQEELHAKHGMLADLAVKVPGMLYQYRLYPDGRVSCPFVSESVVSMLGLSPEALQQDASHWFDFIYPEDIAGVKESIVESARTLQPWRHEFRYAMPNKGISWFVGESTPERLEDGSILWHGFLRDVAEQKQAESALKQSEAQFRQLADSLPQLVWITRPDGHHEYFNQRWYAFTGARPGETDGTGWSELLHPDDYQRTLDIWSHSLRTGEPYSIEYRFRDRDGGYRWFLGKALPIRNGKNEIVRWFGTCTDIHDQKISEEALKQSEKRLLLAQQAARIGSFEWDIQANTRRWSPEKEALYGMAPGTFDGSRETMMNIIHPDDRSDAGKLIVQALETGELDTEWRVVLPNGETRWLAVRAQVFFDEQEKPLQMVGINMDITEKRQANRDKNQLSEQRQRVLDAARLGWWHYDPNNLTATVDERYREIFGFTENQRPISEIVKRLHPDDRPNLLAKIHAAQNPIDPKPYENEYRIILPDGSIRWVEARGMAAFEGEGSLRRAVSVTGTVADITERKYAERLHKLTQFSIERAADPIFWITQDMGIHLVNQAACLHLGYSHDELLGLSVPDIDPLFPLETCDAIWSRLRQEKSITFEGLHKTKDGRLIPVEISGNHIEYEGQEYNCTFVRDITERRQAEQRIQRLTRLYAALSHCNQAIARASNEQALFQEICQVSVEHGSMKMAWIGMIDQDTMKIQPAASYGICPDYLKNMRASIEAALPEEQDLFGTVIRENQPAWCQNCVDSDFSMPTKERAIKYGWNGLAVLPIHRNGNTVGTFAVYAGEVDAFDESAQSLLLEIAGSIDFALDNFEQAAERDRAIQALRESEAIYSALFASNTVVMLLLDPVDGSIINANERASGFYGYGIETLKSMNIREINLSLGKQIQTTLKRALDGKNSFLFQHRMASGDLRDVEVFSGPVVINGRELLLSSVHDITERNKARQELESSRERLAELSTQLIHAQEQEKKNLARELHDELGQRFTSLNITLHHLRSQLCCDDPRETWQKVSDDVAALIQRVRDISQSLRPSMLDYLGLGAAVEYLLKEHFAHSAIKYVFEYAGLPDKLPSQIEITAYRIVQESITNVVRHSKATQVVIELNGGEDAQDLEIVIRDNGMGFDLDKTRQRMSRSGIGVMGMKERVRLLGGEFTLVTKPGSGTRINVMLPLK